MVPDDDTLHDPGLRLGAVLARLLPVGVLIVGPGDVCRYASPLARKAIGETEDAALISAWKRIADGVAADAWASVRAGDQPLQLLLDVPDETRRRLRLEIHRIDSAYIVLVRDVRVDDTTDRTLFLASEALAHRRALSGLVHEAKGPLNNFQLTLTLLSAGLERLDTGGIAADVTARWRRHFDVLRAETVRLTERLGEIDALAHGVDAGWVPVDVSAALRDVMRLLRHEATMNELAIDVDAPSDALTIRGDPRALQLALLGLTACVADAAEPGGVIRLRAERRGNARVHMCIDATTATLPIDLHTTMFRIGCAIDSCDTNASAGRLIIEAHGGSIVLHEDSGVQRGFDIELPSG